jgi:hypothetical protein
MSDFLHQHSSLLIAGLLFAVLMAGWAMVRGIFRILRMTVAFGIGFALGSWAFIEGPHWFRGIIEFPSEKALAGLSVVAGAIGYFGSTFALRKLLGDVPAHAARSTTKLTAALLSLLPTGLFVWVAGTMLRLSGSMAGLAHIDDGAGARPWLAQVRDSLNTGMIGRLFEATDPFTDDAAVHLCEVLVHFRVHEHADILRTSPHYRPLDANPKFQRLLNDRDVKRAIAFCDYARLLTLREVKETATDPKIAAALAALPRIDVRRAERVM